MDPSGFEPEASPQPAAHSTRLNYKPIKKNYKNSLKVYLTNATFSISKKPLSPVKNLMPIEFARTYPTQST